MTVLTWVHVAGGVVALLAGAIAIAVRKGARWHVVTGQAFCLAMFVLGLTAALLSPMKTPPESPVGGILVCYFVATAWMAARRRDGIPGRFESLACFLALAMAAAILARAYQLSLAPPPIVVPPGPIGLFVLGTLCLLAGLGDLRFVLRGRLTPTQRLSRHLWRMCFAFFIATGSFFLGQQDVLPSPMRGSVLQFALAFAPFGAMLFWLVRVRIARGRRPASVLAGANEGP